MAEIPWSGNVSCCENNTSTIYICPTQARMEKKMDVWMNEKLSKIL